MDLDTGAQDPHQKDFIHTLFHANDGELFHTRPPGPPSATHMNFTPQPPPMVNMPMSIESFQSLMNPSEGTGQQGMSSQGQATPQSLLEQQMRLNQLQQLQQLQNQIFQQQLELLSGQTTTFVSMPPTTDRQRDQQYLPTPVNSTELRAQPSPNFVSPMILQSHNQAYANMAQGQSGVPHQTLSDFPSHLMPSAPHSAPANIVFQTQSPLNLPSSSELDFNNISPLTSPWLGAYTGSVPGPGPRGAVPSAGSKRRIASSSGDESAAPPKPARKRTSPAVRGATGAKAPAAPKKTTRNARSANSTPIFPAMSHHAMLGGGPDPADIPNDTPSPIELPPMPPPAHLPSGSIQSQSQPISPVSSSAATTPTMAVPHSGAGSPTSIMPVTPSSIMNLGRLGISNPQAPPKDPGGSRKRDGAARARASSKSSAAAESSRVTRTADRGANMSLVSPSLKPIRPAGNAPAMEPTSSGGFAPPVPVQFRKSSHKAAEQKRRDSLKTSFDDLRLLLPPIPLPSDEGYPDEPILPGAMPPRGPPKGNIEGPNRGVSKLQLLRCGNEYIKLLKGRVERRDEEIDKLRREIARLRFSVNPEDAEAGEHIDLGQDLDGVENVGSGIFSRAMNIGRPNSIDEDDGDEEGGEL